MQVKRRWARGFRSRGVNPDTAWAEIERIRHGRRIVAEQVVDAARSSASPLHRIFEWDNTKAAHEYRLTQARSLLRSIEIEIVPAKGDPTRTRAYMSVASADDEEDDDSGTARSVYIPMPEALGAQATRDEIVRGALRELKGWKERYGRYQSLAGAAKAVGEILKKHARRLNGGGKAA